jgi:uncharacterized protein YraI
MRIKRLLAVAVAAALASVIGIGMAPPAATAAGTYRTVAASLTVRTGPGTGYITVKLPGSP